MRWLVVAVVAVVAVGCGEARSADRQAAETAAKAKGWTIHRCTHVSGGFRACTMFFELKEERSAIYRRNRDHWRKVIGPLPRRLGWWRRVLASPDRRTLLAQWSGECEVQSTHIVSTAGGKARPVFPLAGVASFALGWSGDGRARVALPAPIMLQRGRFLHAGIYRVNPVTLALERERPIAAVRGC